MNIHPCLKCGNDTINPKFCCRSCSVSFSNSENSKRKLTGSCKICGVPVYSVKKYCKKCSPHRGDITLSEAIYKAHHKSSAFALVRSRARRVAELLGWTTCSFCGYDKHVEVSHRKAISTFSEDTLLSTINNPTNLVPLCPNCHWEFDHGLLLLN